MADPWFHFVRVLRGTTAAERVLRELCWSDDLWTILAALRRTSWRLLGAAADIVAVRRTSWRLLRSREAIARDHARRCPDRRHPVTSGPEPWSRRDPRGRRPDRAHRRGLLPDPFVANDGGVDGGDHEIVARYERARWRVSATFGATVARAPGSPRVSAMLFGEGPRTATGTGPIREAFWPPCARWSTSSGRSCSYNDASGSPSGE